MASLRLYNLIRIFVFSTSIVVLTACTEPEHLTYAQKYQRLCKQYDAMSEQEQIDAVKKFAWRIKFISDPSPAVQEAAVYKDPNVLVDIKNPTVDVQLYSIKKIMKDGSFTIELTKILSRLDEKAQIEAVRLNPQIVKFIPYPSPAVQLEAVKRNPYLAKHIHKLTQEAKKEAIIQSPRMKRFFEEKQKRD